MSIEAMKQALEALDKMYSAAPDIAEPAAQTLRTAIEQAEKQEPAAWKHDCAALLQNDVELWIDRCPHCGKPRITPPAAQEEIQRLSALVRAQQITIDKLEAQPAPVQEPLSHHDVMQMARDVGFDLEPTRNRLFEVRGQHAQLLNLVRAIEAAHGITKGK